MVSKKSKDHELYKDYRDSWKRVRKATIHDLSKSNGNIKQKTTFVDYIFFTLILLGCIVFIFGIFLTISFIILVGLIVLIIATIATFVIRSFK